MTPPWLAEKANLCKISYQSGIHKEPSFFTCSAQSYPAPSSVFPAKGHSIRWDFHAGCDAQHAGWSVLVLGGLAPLTPAFQRRSIGYIRQHRFRDLWSVDFFPVGVAVCVVYLIQRHTGYRLRIGGAALAICVVLLFALSQTGLISKRIETTSDEITVMLFSGAGTPDATSFIERGDMWRAALMAFAERSLLGIGLGQMSRYFKEAHAAGLVSDYVVQRNRGSGHTYAHSDYFHTAATRGLFGLISLALIYGVPLWLSIKSRKIIGTLFEQLGLFLEPVFHRLKGRTVAQCFLRDVLIVDLERSV